MSTDCDKAIVHNSLTCSSRKDNVRGILPQYALPVFEDTPKHSLELRIEPSCPRYLGCVPEIRRDTSRPRCPTIQPVSVCT